MTYIGKGYRGRTRKGGKSINQNLADVIKRCQGKKYFVTVVSINNRRNWSSISPMTFFFGVERKGRGGGSLELGL